MSEDGKGVIDRELIDGDYRRRKARERNECLNGCSLAQHNLSTITELEKKFDDWELTDEGQEVLGRIEKLEKNEDHWKNFYAWSTDEYGEIVNINRMNKGLSELKLKYTASIINQNGIMLNIKELKEQKMSWAIYEALNIAIQFEYNKIKEVLRELKYKVELVAGYMLNQKQFDYVFDDKYWKDKKKFGGENPEDGLSSSSTSISILESLRDTGSKPPRLICYECEWLEGNWCRYKKESVNTTWDACNNFNPKPQPANPSEQDAGSARQTDDLKDYLRERGLDKIPKREYLTPKEIEELKKRGSQLVTPLMPQSKEWITVEKADLKTILDALAMWAGVDYLILKEMREKYMKEDKE